MRRLSKHWLQHMHIQMRIHIDQPQSSTATPVTGFNVVADRCVYSKWKIKVTVETICSYSLLFNHHCTFFNHFSSLPSSFFSTLCLLIHFPLSPTPPPNNLLPTVLSSFFIHFLIHLSFSFPPPPSPPTLFLPFLIPDSHLSYIHHYYLPHPLSCFSLCSSSSFHQYCHHQTTCLPHTQEKDRNLRRITRMVLVVVAVFIVCWTPIHIFVIITALINIPSSTLQTITWHFCIALGYTNRYTPSSSHKQIYCST